MLGRRGICSVILFYARSPADMLGMHIHPTDLSRAYISRVDTSSHPTIPNNKKPTSLSAHTINSLKPALLLKPRYRFNSVPNTELIQNRGDVIPHCTRRQIQLTSDFFCRLPFSNKSKHLAFTLRQRIYRLIPIPVGNVNEFWRVNSSAVHYRSD